MSNCPFRTQPASRTAPRLPRCLSTILVLLLSLIPLVGPHQSVAQAAAAWPYTALQSELDTTYNAIQQAVAPLPALNVPTQYIVPLFWADGTIGHGLVGTNGNLVSFNLARSTLFLQSMQRAGFTATMIEVPWPLLDPTSSDPNLPYYQSFYTQVVAQAKAMGMWVAVNSGISPTGSVNYGVYTSIDQVFQGVRRQSWWMAQTLQPDWVLGNSEPTTEQQILHGIPDVGRLDANYYAQHFAQLMAGKPTGTPTRYAGGASPHDPQAYADAAIASPLDGFDSHPFPLTNSWLKTGQQYWNLMLNRFDQARAAGKALLVTQTSPYKESAQETGQARLSSNTIYLRDVWDGFQPQDQHFMLMWQQIAQKKGLTATCYWWANRTFWGGYIPYNPLLTYSKATQQVDSASWANLQKSGYVINAEGQLWASFVSH